MLAQMTLTSIIAPIFSVTPSNKIPMAALFLITYLNAFSGIQIFRHLKCVFLYIFTHFPITLYILYKIFHTLIMLNMLFFIDLNQSVVIFIVVPLHLATAGSTLSISHVHLQLPTVTSDLDA